ncbi:hypothetical protein CDL15_Pgr016605 [Punica granatum]|uniref:Uncharacterized protein n=1 Tax=Punica granatum TaxID=22663 RepID=A0A218XUU0_PUNGR|nr:hypothetical protein CDL15_Pgr016605 [Punica granatum]
MKWLCERKRKEREGGVGCDGEQERGGKNEVVLMERKEKVDGDGVKIERWCEDGDGRGEGKVMGVDGEEMETREREEAEDEIDGQADCDGDVKNEDEHRMRMMNFSGIEIEREAEDEEDDDNVDKRVPPVCARWRLRQFLTAIITVRYI